MNTKTLDKHRNLLLRPFVKVSVKIARTKKAIKNSLASRETAEIAFSLREQSLSSNYSDISLNPDWTVLL